jgi:transposase
MKNRGKRYPKAFKRECVDYVRKNQDIPVSEAADNLGVPNSTLQRWVKQADIDDGISKSGALTSVEKLEFQRLKREVRKRKIEAKIFKKAAPVL